MPPRWCVSPWLPAQNLRLGMLQGWHLYGGRPACYNAAEKAIRATRQRGWLKSLVISSYPSPVVVLTFIQKPDCYSPKHRNSKEWTKVCGQRLLGNDKLWHRNFCGHLSCLSDNYHWDTHKPETIEQVTVFSTSCLCAAQSERLQKASLPYLKLFWCRVYRANRMWETAQNFFVTFQIKNSLNDLYLLFWKAGDKKDIPCQQARCQVSVN